MTLRSVPLALLALLLACSGAAFAGETSEKWVVVDPGEFAGGTDAYVDSARPAENFGQRDSLEVAADPTSIAFLNFPFLPAFPKNATLLSAHLSLVQIDVSGNLFGTESLRVSRVNGPWDEGTVSFNTRPEIGSTIASRAPQNGQLVVYNFTVTDTLRAARDGLVNGTAPFHGFAVTAVPRAVPTIPGGDSTFDAVFSFASSNRSQAERFLRPSLSLLFEMNGPRLQNFTVNGRANGTFTENRSAQFAVEAFDPHGEVREVRVLLKNETGVTKHQFSLSPTEAYNTSQGANAPPAPVNPLHQHRVWAANVTIPWSPTRSFRADVEAIDNDGNRVNVTVAKEWTARADRLLPTLGTPRVSPATINESERVNVTLPIGDNEGIANVTLYVSAGTQTLHEIPMRPLLGRARVNDTYFANFTLDNPGRFGLVVAARDLSNGENATALPEVRVLDITPPLLVEPTALGPRGTPFDEAGSLVTFRVTARDASTFTLTLNLTSPSGGTLLKPVTKESGDTYSVAFTVEEVGEWTGFYLGRDAAGNEGTSVPFAFTVSSAQKPLFLWAGETPGAYLNATPVLELRILDPNLDRSTVKVLLTVDGLPKTEFPLTTLASPGGITLRLAPVFAVGEEVALTVEAADRLGNQGSAAYAYRVDRAAPATFLSLEPALALEDGGYRASALTRYTLEAQDTASGLRGTFWRLASEGPNARHPYAGPVQVRPTGPGDRFLFWSEDKAGNAETPQEVRLLFATEPPAVKARVEAGILVGTASPGTPGVALRNVTVLMRPVGGATWTLLSASLTTNRTTQAVAFRAPLPALGAGSVVEYAVYAEDVLGVETFPLASPKALGEHVEGNHLPTGGIVEPAAGQRLKGDIPIRWAFADVDGDLLRVSAVVRGGFLAESTRLTDAGAAQGSTTWRTARWPNGPYEIVVTVVDASNEPQTFTRLIHLDNPGAGALLVTPANLTGDTSTVFTVKARVNADVSSAHLVFKGPQEIRVPLYDDGQHDDNRSGDGVYAGTVALPEEGTYTGALEILDREGKPLLSDARVEAQVASDSLIPGPGALLLLGCVGLAVLVGRIGRRS